MSKARSRKRKGVRGPRALALKGGLLGSGFLLLWTWLGVWFVHQPEATRSSWPHLLSAPLSWIGDPVGDFTDAMGFTGRDVVYEYDETAPSGTVTFAGLPVRTGSPAPDDIVILDRGDFIIGWSPSLQHPVWVAYHVPAAAAHEVGPRPNFSKDPAVPSSPKASSYERSGYDRGHMAPNFAIASRFGAERQKTTFLMSNIAPQSPALNRGVWKNIEHRIASLWTARWGEVWVIVGCISDKAGKKFGVTNIDVPERFYQVVVAQEGLDVRAFAVIFDQDVPWDTWPTHSIVSIDELEEMSGLDFLPDLPEFIQRPLESERPTRLWPIRKIDLFKHLALRFN